MAGELSDLASLYFDAVVDGKSPTLAPATVADILERLAWTGEASAGVGKLVDDWFFSSDVFRVEVVLSLEEMFVNAPQEQLLKRLSEIESFWPELAEKCEQYRAATARIASS